MYKFLFAGLVCVCLGIACYPSRAGEPGTADEGASIEKARTLLASGDPRRVDKAVSLVIRLGPKASECVPILVGMLADERAIDPDAMVSRQPTVQERAAEGLEEIGAPAVGPLINRLEVCADTKERLLIITTLGRIGADAQAAGESLLTCAKSQDVQTRYSAVEAFAKVTGDSRVAVPQLTRFLEDEDPNVKSAAVQSLKGIGPQAASAIPQLITLLDSEDHRGVWYTPDSAGSMPLRVDVADCLAKIGVRDEQAVAKLTSLLKHDDPSVRIAAAHAHCVLSEDVNAGLVILGSSLTDRSHGYSVVCEAALALADLGERARPLAGQLVDLLHDDKVMVRCAAVEAVASVQPPEFFDLLVRCAHDEHEVVRMAVIDSVANLVSRGAPVDKPAIVELLTKGLDDGSWVVRSSAMNGLGRLGQDARAALPRLRELAASKDAWNRQAAKDAIERIDGRE